jgi:hypothetical protein
VDCERQKSIFPRHYCVCFHLVGDSRPRVILTRRRYLRQPTPSGVVLDGVKRYLGIAKRMAQKSLLFEDEATDPAPGPKLQDRVRNS